MSPCWFDGLIFGRVEKKGREKIQKVRARGRKQSQPREALGGIWGGGVVGMDHTLGTRSPCPREQARLVLPFMKVGADSISA